MQNEVQPPTTFAFFNLTNLEKPATPSDLKKHDQRLKLLALNRLLLQDKAGQPPLVAPSHDFGSFRESLMSGRLRELAREREQTAAVGFPPRERVLRKVNCAYFRGKKAVFKSSNVRISFEIADSI